IPAVPLVPWPEVSATVRREFSCPSPARRRAVTGETGSGESGEVADGRDVGAPRREALAVHGPQPREVPLPVADGHALGEDEVGAALPLEVVEFVEGAVVVVGAVEEALGNR